MVVPKNKTRRTRKKKNVRRKYCRKFMFFLFYKIINQFNCFSSTFIRCILFYILYILLLVCVCICVLQIDLWDEFILFEFNEISIENLLQLLFTIFLGFSFLLRFLFVCLVCFRFFMLENVYVHSNCIIIKSYFLNLIFIEGFQYSRKHINQWSIIASQNNHIMFYVETEVTKKLDRWF